MTDFACPNDTPWKGKMPTTLAEQIRRFQTGKAYAYFDGHWHHCTHRECKKRKTCTGGPRGTCRRTKGVPLCQLAGSRGREMAEIANRLATLGPEPDKHL